jgi:hypothetical protein
MFAIINYNTVSSLVPVLGWENSFEINLRNFIYFEKKGDERGRAFCVGSMLRLLLCCEVLHVATTLLSVL